MKKGHKSEAVDSPVLTDTYKYPDWVSRMNSSGSKYLEDGSVWALWHKGLTVLLGPKPSSPHLHRGFKSLTAMKNAKYFISTHLFLKGMAGQYKLANVLDLPGHPHILGLFGELFWYRRSHSSP